MSMRKIAVAGVCAVVALAGALALAGDAGKQVTVNGWITDSYCGGKNASTEGKACALKCVEKGAKLVLYSPADQKTFSLDSQEKAKEHVGYEVKVSGTLDEATQTIKVGSIEAAKKADSKG
jgi:type 1 fimbria pilin